MQPLTIRAKTYFRQMAAYLVIAAMTWLLAACGESPEQRAQRLATLQSMDPVEIGRLTHQRLKCFACHSLDGSDRAGPSYLGIYGKPVQLRDGTVVLRDETYLKRSMLDPKDQVVAGYAPQMRSYRKQLSDIEIRGLIALIRALDNPQ